MRAKSPYYTKGDLNTYMDAMQITQEAVEPFATVYDISQSFVTSDIPIHFI
ncbi:MAG: hypothetical protein ABF285_11275 [Pacificibacter sp.]